MKRLIPLILLVLILTFCLSACNKEMVNGSIKQTETEFTVSYDLLNTKLSHSMELGEGDTIAVALLSDKGRIDVLVTDPDGDTVYQGNDASTGSFTLEITKAGAYTFSVTGKGAKGSFSFIVNK